MLYSETVTNLSIKESSIYARGVSLLYCLPREVSVFVKKACLYVSDYLRKIIRTLILINASVVAAVEPLRMNQKLIFNLE